MFRKFIFKTFILFSVILSGPTYAQTTDVSEDVKAACKSLKGGNAFWSDTENVCSQTFKNADAEIIHYVGGWSLTGAAGYGQLYVYDSKDGSLVGLYKGQFKDSLFHGFGHFEETFFNTEGESLTRTSIGNWNEDGAHGFIYQKIVNNDTQEVSTFYGDMNNGRKEGNSVIFTKEDGASNVIWKESKYVSHTSSQLFSDETVYAWVQYKFFDNEIVESKDNDVEVTKISSEE